MDSSLSGTYPIKSTNRWIQTYIFFGMDFRWWNQLSLELIQSYIPNSCSVLLDLKCIPHFFMLPLHPNPPFATYLTVWPCRAMRWSVLTQSLFLPLLMYQKKWRKKESPLLTPLWLSYPLQLRLLWLISRHSQPSSAMCPAIAVMDQEQPSRWESPAWTMFLHITMSCRHSQRRERPTGPTLLTRVTVMLMVQVEDQLLCLGRLRSNHPACSRMRLEWWQFLTLGWWRLATSAEEQEEWLAKAVQERWEMSSFPDFDSSWCFAGLGEMSSLPWRCVPAWWRRQHGQRQVRKKKNQSMKCENTWTSVLGVIIVIRVSMDMATWSVISVRYGHSSTKCSMVEISKKNYSFNKVKF